MKILHNSNDYHPPKNLSKSMPDPDSDKATLRETREKKLRKLVEQTQKLIMGYDD